MVLGPLCEDRQSRFILIKREKSIPCCSMVIAFKKVSLGLHYEPVVISGTYKQKLCASFEALIFQGKIRNFTSNNMKLTLPPYISPTCQYYLYVCLMRPVLQASKHPSLPRSKD